MSGLPDSYVAKPTIYNGVSAEDVYSYIATVWLVILKDPSKFGLLGN